MLHIQRAGYARDENGRPGHSYYTTLAVDDIARISASDLVLVTGICGFTSISASDLVLVSGMGGFPRISPQT